jgi:hypothetical protein
MAIEYTGDDDPRKVQAAVFFADGAEAAFNSMAAREEYPRLADMVATAQSIKKSVLRKKRKSKKQECTDAQLRAVEKIYHGIRSWVHGKAEA